MIRQALASTSVVAALTLALASGALGAGSPSPSRPPAPAQPRASNYELAVNAIKARDYPRALGLLQKVVRAEPRNADAWNWMGFSHRSLRQFDQALAAYQKALEIDPRHLGAHEYLGELHLMRSEPDKARAELDRLNALCPSGCKERDDLLKAIKAYEARARG